MKKWITVSIILFFVQITTFADGLLDLALDIGHGAVSVASDVKSVAQYNDYNYKDQIADLVLEIPSGTTKDDFYNKHSQKGLTAALSNLFIGFGSGSKSQGNIPSYLFQKNTDTIAWTIGLGVPLVCLTASIVLLPFYSVSESANFEDNPLVKISLFSVIIGGSISLVNRTFGTISAFTFAHKYNKELDKQIQISVIPNTNNSLSFIGKIALN